MVCFQPRKDYIRSVPAYHTTLDTFDYMKQFIDPEFKVCVCLLLEPCLYKDQKVVSSNPTQDQTWFSQI